MLKLQKQLKMWNKQINSDYYRRTTSSSQPSVQSIHGHTVFVPKGHTDLNQCLELQLLWF